jgi:hypothetical protein
VDILKGLVEEDYDQKADSNQEKAIASQLKEDQRTLQ